MQHNTSVKRNTPGRNGLHFELNFGHCAFSCWPSHTSGCMALHKVLFRQQCFSRKRVCSQNSGTITGTVGITSDAAAGAMRIKPGSVPVNHYALIYQGAATV